MNTGSASIAELLSMYREILRELRGRGGDVAHPVEFYAREAHE